MFKPKRSIVLCLVLAFALLASTSAQWIAQAQTDTLPGMEEAIQAALDGYQKELGVNNGTYQLGKTQAEQGWAFAAAQEQLTNDVERQGNSVVILAHQVDEKNWLALAPTNRDLDAYNQLLKEFPENLIDAATKDYLYQYRPSFVESTFTGQRLPWPAGRPGNASNRDNSGHTNQVDFTTSNTDIVFAVKPGKVVFIKESSNTNCTEPPATSNCWQKANVVVIRHSANEYSWYYHLAYNSVVVELDSYVEFGTQIGTEGYTGYTYPANFRHLHYMVSSSIPTWTDPANSNAAPWPPAGSLGTVDFDEATWSQLAGALTSQNTSDPSAVSWGLNRVDLFVQGEDNQLWHTSSVNWNTWEPLQGILTSAPDAASWGSGHMDVYVRGLNNRLYYRRYLSNAWSGWNAVPELTGGATSNPSAVSWGYGRIDLFVRGSDNGLWQISYTYSNNTWSAWTPISGKTMVGGPDAASLASGSLDVFVRGTDNGVWYKRYRNGSWSANWTQVPEAIVTADPGAAASYSNQMDLFVRGVSKVLWHRPYTTAWGAWDPMDGILTSGPDAASWRSGHLDVFVRGTDNHIYHRYKTNGGSWSNWAGITKPNP